MFFSPPASRRALKHQRAIEIDAYARDDGLWDIEARIRDSKTSDTALSSGTRPAGMPIHDLGLRISITTEFEIVAVEAVSAAVPYPGYCNTITPDYNKLVGLNLLKQFRYHVKSRFGEIQGCTHLTELAQILPTAAVQAFAGEVIKMNEAGSKEADEGTGDSQQQPFQLNRCHALKLDGAAVATYYPRWYKPASAI